MIMLLSQWEQIYKDSHTDSKKLAACHNIYAFLEKLLGIFYLNHGAIYHFFLPSLLIPLAFCACFT